MLSLGRNNDEFSTHRRLIACVELRRNRLEECDVMLADFYPDRGTAAIHRERLWRRDVVRERCPAAICPSSTVGHKAADDVARKSIRPEESTLISTECMDRRWWHPVHRWC